jgi:hypothetical protein
MNCPATPRLIASLLAALVAGAASAVGEPGYPPPPGPYRSGPWVDAAGPPQPASEPTRRTTPMGAGGIPQPGSADALQPDTGADYSAANLFGSSPAANDPAQVPAWPETLVSAPREPLYQPPARQPDFSIGGQREQPPGDFAPGFGQQRSPTPSEPVPPPQAPPVGWRQGADFTGMPATLPGAMPHAGAGRQPAVPAPGQPMDRPAQTSATGAATRPLPKPTAPGRSPAERVDPATQARLQDPGSPVFRPPGPAGD